MAGRGYTWSAAVLVVTGGIVLVLAVVPADAGRSAARAPVVKPFTMLPIVATFLSKDRETRYTARWDNLAGASVSVTWTLHLELVDPAGAPATGEPGSGAEVDARCDNAGRGLPNKPEVYTPPADVGKFIYSFYWHHPDAAESVPPDKFHCNHLDMGPRGHQGLITVVIKDFNSDWECSASYKGTNSTSSEPFSPPTAADIKTSVKNGVASTPKCSPIH